MASAIQWTVDHRGIGKTRKRPVNSYSLVFDTLRLAVQKRALRSISKFVGIEFCRSASFDISAGPFGEHAQGILGA